MFVRPPKPKLAPIDIRHLVSGVASLLKRDPAFPGLDVTIDGEPPAGIQADATLLAIVFQNLLMNAAQAMQGRGTIRVSLSSPDRALRVAVADDGPGLPAEIKAALFRPFKTTKSRGTGLGMATAKRLIELHGGRIAVSSPDGGGTTVTLDLPLAEPAS